MTLSLFWGRFGACLLLVWSTFATAAFASIIEPTATLPPPDSLYNVPDTCILPVCLGNITISDFVITGSQIVGGNQLILTAATINANVFQNNAGVPGTFINPIVLAGSINFTFFGRTSLNELGTFNAQITSLSFSGTFNGITGPHTVEAQLNPAQVSEGTTTVARYLDTTKFEITSFFDVFAELSTDSEPFVPGPVRPTEVSTTPEPASTGLALAGCLAVAVLNLRRRSASR